MAQKSTCKCGASVNLEVMRPIYRTKDSAAEYVCPKCAADYDAGEAQRLKPNTSTT